MENSNDVIAISWRTFVDRFRPTSKGIAEGITSIPMFETFGEDLRTVLNTADRHIWTVIDIAALMGDDAPKDEDGDDCWLIVTGYHRVNRIGYVITEAPWDDDQIEVRY